MGLVQWRQWMAAAIMCSLAPSFAPAQETLAVQSSIALPPEVAKRLGEVHLRTSCGDDGSVIISLSEHSVDIPSPLARLSTDGTLLTEISFDHVPGFEKGEVEDFAAGPNRETYVVGNALLGGTPETGLDYGQVLTLLRFDADGHLVARHSLTRKIAHPRMAVFTSGDALIVGLAVDGPYRGLSLAALVSPDGVLLRETGLPEALTTREPTYNSAHQPKTKSPMLVPLIADNHRIAVLREGRTGAIAFISSALEINPVLRLQNPPFTNVHAPAVLGPGWLLAILEDYRPADQRERPRYARFNLQDGETLATYPIKPPLTGTACKTSDGIQFFDLVHGTLTVAVPVNAPPPGPSGARNQR
jgi:hypothetical protein